MSGDMERREDHTPEKKEGPVSKALTLIAVVAIIIVQLFLAVLGMAMTIAALSVPVLLVLALVRWLFG